jgi:hypothetical protein
VRVAPAAARDAVAGGACGEVTNEVHPRYLVDRVLSAQIRVPFAHASELLRRQKLVRSSTEQRAVSKKGQKRGATPASRAPLAAVVSQAEGTMTLKVTVGRLPAAPLVGFADRVAIMERNSLFELSFVEDRGQAPALLVARLLTTADALWKLWSSSQTMYGKLRQVLGGLRQSAAVNDVAVPTASVSVAPLCNLFRAAGAGSEALIECYYISAHAINNARAAGDPVDVLPLLGVQIPATLMLRVFEYLESNADSIRALNAAVSKQPESRPS